MSAEICFLKRTKDKEIEYILYSAVPYLVARVYQFPDPERMERFIKKYAQAIEGNKPEGYRILICCHGNIDNILTEPVPASGLNDEQKKILQFITKCYEEERIRNSQKHYQRYAES